MALQVTKHYTELVKEAILAEREGEFEQAASLYEQAIRQEPFEEKPFSRLMVLYRQQKKYKEELKVIDKALTLFKNFYDDKPEKILGKNSAAARTSKALLKSVSGKIKNEPYYPEPIPGWIRRKAVVEKKLKK